MITLNIGDSDEKADWIKMIDGGQARLRDLAASDAAIAQLRAARKRNTPPQSPPPELPPSTPL